MGVGKKGRALTGIVLCALLPFGGPLKAEELSPFLKNSTIHPERWPKLPRHELVSRAVERRIDDLLKRMTLREKVGQLIQADISNITPADLSTYPLGSVLAGGNSGPNGDERASGRDWRTLVDAFKAAALQPGTGRTPIPLIFGIDAVHGHNNIPGSTVFPHNIGLGAAHDPGLIRRIGEATAAEVRATGIDWVFAPTLAVPRDMRWGRTFEGYSNDPALVASLAAPMIDGLQGPRDTPHLAATAKHFIGDGDTADGIDQGDAQASEAELIRVDAAGYLSAIQAGVLTVMVSYSSWHGVKMHGNRALLTDVLKGRLGFDGFVVGDWNGHGQVPGCTNENCPIAINAGIDMLMAPDSWRKLFENTLAQARSGEISLTRLDDAVRRILRVKFKLGLFDLGPAGSGDLAAIGGRDHRELAREAVRKSLVLLKNNGVLPIKPNARILVAGDAADDVATQTGGWTITWQGSDTRRDDFPQAVTVLSALRDAVRASGGTVESAGSGDFTNKPDVAIVVFGERPYAEMFGDLKSPSYLQRGPLWVLKRLKARGIPTVAIFMSGRPLEVDDELQNADAFVAAWLPGTEGEGIADVLIADTDGKPAYDFSGRLSYPWPSLSSRDAAPREASERFPRGFGLGYGAKRP